MAGRGPAPKDPSRLAGHGAAKKRAGQIRVVEVDPTDQPSLQELFGDENPATGLEWSKATLRFWGEIGEFVKVQLLQNAQWSLLGRAMILDDAVNRGELKLASEARLQIAKFGIAPDDMARMRIQFAAAEEADEKRDRRRAGSAGASVRDKYSKLKAVD